MNRFRHLGTLAACAALLLTAACTGAAPDTAVRAGSVVTGTEVVREPAVRKAKPVVVVAVGDIACRAGQEKTAKTCRQRDTADLAEDIDPDAVLVLGDTQYDKGELSDYRKSYDASWGDLRPITYPVPGNHEYYTEGAEGYYTYFRNRQPGPPGYYAVDLNEWRVYALNSNCTEIDCAAQYDWLRADLEENPRACSLFAMHHPRYSSGQHGSDVAMKRFFRIGYRHRVEMVLSGHDHHYERFKRMDAFGQVAAYGPIQFVSGAGGRSHYPADDPEVGSAARVDDLFGVLRLGLRDRSFRWAFKGVDGSTPDSGTRTCLTG